MWFVKITKRICSAQVGRWELPGSCLLNDVQYFPKGPDFPLTDELRLHLVDAGVPVPDSFQGPTNLAKRDFDTSFYNRIRIVREKLVDRVDAPRFFPGVGLAQLHHAQYKVTIYGETLPVNAVRDQTFGYVRNGFYARVERLFISHDYLHICDTASSFEGTANNAAQPASVDAIVSSVAATAAASTVRIGSTTVESQGAQNTGRIITAPDGTIYKLGRGESATPLIGNEAAPYFLYVPTLYASLGRTGFLESEPPTESEIRRASNLPRFIDEYQSSENNNENKFEVPLRSS